MKRRRDELQMLNEPRASILSSIHEFFFGFLYEDETEAPTEDEQESIRPTIYGALCVHLFLQSAAAASALAQGHTTASILGTAIGKLVTGLLPDMMGARFTSTLFSLLLAATFLYMSLIDTPPITFFLVEFCYAVQWPCVVLVLHAHRQLDQGVFWTSLACRLGSIVGVWLFRFQWLLSAWFASLAASIIYHYVHDTPEATHQPLNPIVFPQQTTRPIRKLSYILRHHLFPAVSRIVQSPKFWMLATAHTGASLIRTADRVMPGPTGIGTFLGLVIAGPLFAHQPNVRARKWMVSRLYGAAVVACYGMVVVVGWDAELARVVRNLCMVLASFGMAVPFYHIPSLVATDADKGLFLAYTDGMAYAAASAVWCAGNSSWTWALIALWVLVAGVVMVEFLELYLCRPSHKDYETILLA